MSPGPRRRLSVVDQCTSRAAWRCAETGARACQASSGDGVRYDVLSYWSVLDQPGNREVAEHLQVLYEEFYDGLAKDLQARRIAVGVLVMPSKFDVMAGRSPEEGFFVRLAEERGIPYLRLLPALDSRRSPYPFLLYDGHLNEQGNKVVAEAVFDWLFRSDTAPFPQLRG